MIYDIYTCFEVLLWVFSFFLCLAVPLSNEQYVVSGTAVELRPKNSVKQTRMFCGFGFWTTRNAAAPSPVQDIKAIAEEAALDAFASNDAAAAAATVSCAMQEMMSKANKSGYLKALQVGA